MQSIPDDYMPDDYERTHRALSPEDEAWLDDFDADILEDDFEDTYDDETGSDEVILNDRGSGGLRLTGARPGRDTGLIQEKAFLVALNTEGTGLGEEQTERSLDELKELAEACGAEVLGQDYQNRAGRDAATYIGSGKLDEIAAEAERLGCNTLIFDDELPGSQMRNIQERTKFKVLDRTLVILDIFARRATSKEGKLQVELAQYEYRLGRVALINESMSRLGGGIGTRGPGETQLETDRRHIRGRINRLKKDLKAVGERRRHQRRKRSDLGQTTIAVVGYTNAGKSTLINRLCSSDLLAMDQVFATLDAAMRDLRLPDGSHVMLVDTVGFIRKLPHQLVEAFHSTLEEVSAADMILHVLDAADPEAESQLKVVEEELMRLEAGSKPRLLALNKMDLVNPEEAERFTHSRQIPSHFRVCPISAVTGEGLDNLLNNIAEMLVYRQKSYTLNLPYRESTLYAYIKDHGNLLEEHFGPETMDLKFTLDTRLCGPVERYLRERKDGR